MSFVKMSVYNALGEHGVRRLGTNIIDFDTVVQMNGMTVKHMVVNGHRWKAVIIDGPDIYFLDPVHTMLDLVHDDGLYQDPDQPVETF